MSYTDASQNRTVALGAVVVVHAALGYALLTGLASGVFHGIVEDPMIIYNVKNPPPPPPLPEIKPQPKTDHVVARSTETVVAPIPKVATPGDGPLVATSLEPIAPSGDAPTGPAMEPPAPPTLSLARGVAPRGNQGDWFPQGSYPAAARRANAEGRVSVRVSVGADGRVTDCTVSASSGNQDLDAATCRLARRNARFEPARDAQGAAVPSSFSVRNVRWRLTE
jgi:protein TonB